MAKIIYTERHIKRAKKFIKKHPDILSQYEKTLKLLEVNPFHPSLRLHKLEGKLTELYSFSPKLSKNIDPLIQPIYASILSRNVVQYYFV